MWISRKRYEALCDRVYRLEADRDAFFKHLIELDSKVRKHEYDIQNNVHYIAPPSDGKKVLHG